MADFSKGLYKDGHPQNQPAGTYRDLVNGSIVQYEAAITQEMGTESFALVTTGHRIIGRIPINDGLVVLFTINTTTGLSEIGILDPKKDALEAGVYTVILRDGDTDIEKLTFENISFVQGEFKINSQGDRIIYWTDNINPPRYLNIDTIEQVEINFDVKILSIFAVIDQVANFLIPGTPTQGVGSFTITGTVSHTVVDGFATGYVDVTSSPTMDGSIVIHIIPEVGTDYPIPVAVTNGQPVNDVATAIESAINGVGGIVYTATAVGSTVNIVANTVGKDFNAVVTVDPDVTGTGLTVSEDANSDDNLFGGITASDEIGGTITIVLGLLTIQVSTIQYDDTKAEIATKLHAALVADSGFNSKFTASLNIVPADPVVTITTILNTAEHNDKTPTITPSGDSDIDFTGYTAIAITGGVGDNIGGIEVSESGGALLSGAYFFPVAYVSSDGVVTNFFTILGPIIITDDNANAVDEWEIDGVEANTPTTKSIRISLEGLDSTFSSLRVGVIKSSNPTVVEFLSDIPIDPSGSISFTYQGTEATTVGTIEEILANRASYEKAGAIRQLDKVLYLGNLTGGTDIGYQKYANNIKVNPVQKVAGKLAVRDNDAATGDHYYESNSPYKDPDRIIVFKGFKRDEVYALYISFILKDGSESAAYHIPGRAPSAGETNLITGSDAADLQAVSNLVGGAKKYQIYGKRAIASGLAYWENENETYPNNANWDIWDVDGSGDGVDSGVSLIGENVRHHHINDNTNELFATGFDNDPDLVVTGLEFTDVKIPDDIKEKILGYKIHYAKRTLSNTRILDQAILHYTSINSGTTEAAEYKVTNKSWGASSSAGTIEARIGTMQPFHMLRKYREGEGYNLNLISYFHEIARFTSFIDGDAATINPETIVTRDRRIIPEDWRSYVEPHSKVDVDGLPELLDNTGQDGIIAFKIPVGTVDTLTADTNCLVNLCIFKRDVYLPFDNQELIWTGYFHAVEGAGNTFNSAEIYGGDTFTTFYAYFGGEVLDFAGPDIVAPIISEIVVESNDNIAMRHQDIPDPIPDGYQDNPDHFTYYPKSDAIFGLIADLDDHPDYFDDTVNAYWRNEIHLNEEYNAVNDIKPAFPERRDNQVANYFPSRVIRSARDTGGIVDNFRIFLANDFKDLPRNRGEIKVIHAQNGILLIHLQRSLFRTRGREELITGDIRAFIGSGDIFGTDPEEIFTTDQGYAGLQDIFASITTPAGYFFVDREANKVYILSDGLKEISGLGLRDYFRTNLNELQSANARVVAGYDPKLHRIFLTKFDGVDSFTLSFLPDRNQWEGFHSGTPDLYITSLRNIFGVVSNDIHRKHANNTRSYFGVNGDFEFEYSANEEKGLEKLIMSAFIDSLILDEDDVELVDEHFTSIRVYSDHQDTSTVTIIPFPDTDHNARRTGRIWKTNSLRDATNYAQLAGIFPAWALRKRMSGKYHLARLSYTNTLSRKIYLFNFDLYSKASTRL